MGRTLFWRISGLLQLSNSVCKRRETSFALILKDV